MPPVHRYPQADMANEIKEPERREGPARGSLPRESTFTRNLRFEVAGEEGRALVASWSASIALGIMWLLLVAFGPKGLPPDLLPPPAPPIEVKFDEAELPPPTIIPPSEG